MIGPELRDFLASRQRDFEDRLGSEILQDSPAELLAALERRQRDFGGINHAAADPILDHAPRVAPKRKTRGVLAILDQIEKENINRRFTD